MEDLGTLGGPTSTAWGISETGEVVGRSENAEGNGEAFLWTREGGMRSLSTLGGPSSDAKGVNTQQWVVGFSDGVPFLWIPERGIRRLQTLGGDEGHPNSLNEVGQITGASVTAQGEVRTALWTPIAGPPDFDPESAARSGEAR